MMYVRVFYTGMLHLILLAVSCPTALEKGQLSVRH